MPAGEMHTKSTGQNQRDLEMPSGCCSRVPETHFSFERSIFILEVRAHFHALSISVSNPTLSDLSDLQTPKNFQLRQRAKESWNQPRDKRLTCLRPYRANQIKKKKKKSPSIDPLPSSYSVVM